MREGGGGGSGEGRLWRSARRKGHHPGLLRGQGWWVGGGGSGPD